MSIKPEYATLAALQEFSTDSTASTEEPAVTTRISFDSAVWQLRDATGNFIHTKTGEVRDEDGFLSTAVGLDSESASEDWNAVYSEGIDAPQGAGWDDTGDHTAALGDDGVGSHGFDDSAQVQPTRSASSDTSDERPSKLAPKKKRK